jgi:hypothetical protein
VDLDPTEYDVDELHELAGTGLAGAVPDPDGAGGFVWVTSTASDDGSGELRVDAGDPTPEQCEQLLRVGGLDPAALGDRPYLDDVPEGEAARATVRDWLEYLVTTGGRDDALAALSRYRTLGWLAADVEDELRRHVTAASEHLDAGGGTLDVADHLLSFGYLIRVLAARDRA